MESNPPLPLAPEQRLLATIVFTDVAGFSARMQNDEARTLKLVDRDFTTMREFAKELSGTVLKSTGDGLLLYFTSAVHAVEWALRTQRFFAEKAKEDAAEDVLRHRVGIHLGDVFMRANDVMGDGVNIAARLQSQAPVGGICISQVVHDVVKSKMTLHVVRLEERRLKNIKENIPMYHVLLDAPRAAAVPLAPPRALAASKREEAPRKSSGPLVLVLLLLAGGGVLGWSMLQHEGEVADSVRKEQELQAILAAKAATPGGEAAMAPASVAPPAAEEIDFARLAMTGGRKDEATLQEAREAAQAAGTWLQAALRGYSAARPLPVELRPELGLQRIYVDAKGQLLIKTGNIDQRFAWEAYPAEEQGAIMFAALRDASAPARAVVRGAEAFAYLHNLSDLASQLTRQRAHWPR